MFDSKLCFKDHIENIVSAAYKTLGFVIRNGRSRLEYAKVLWSPIYRVHISWLENVQREFVTFLVYMLDGEYPLKGFPNELLLERVQIPSLSSRRVYFSVKFLYRIFANRIGSPSLLYKLCLNIPQFYWKNIMVFNSYI